MPTGHLFDPGPFGGAPLERLAPKAKIQPDDAERVPAGDDRWMMFAGVRGVDPVAHVVRSGRSLCGFAKGRPIPLEGTRPVACPKCRERGS